MTQLMSTSDYQTIKNKRRLIQQNTRLKQQVDLIQTQINSLATNDPIQEQIAAQNPHQHLLQELAIQERLMRQLRARIEAFQLQRAKDNVEYIIHEEDDLKIAKQVCAKLADERQVLARRKADKQERLQHDLPYQNYQKQFLQGLTKVVHHNREQAAQITEIQRQIRKYHLMVKNGKTGANSKLSHSPQDLETLERQISEKVQQRRALQRQWKPHLDRLDEEYAKLLRQLAVKKEAAAELDRQERAWDTRMLTVRDPQQVLNNRKRVSQVSINPKLKQQLEDYLINQEEKKKKKVNNQELKYQFKSNKDQEEKEEKAKKPESPLPPALAKKKQDKIIETMHDDKNISKKVQKLTANTAKKGKTDQITNTDLSVPTSKDPQSMSASKQKQINEQRSVRHWEANPEFKKEKTNKEVSLKEKSNVLHLKEVSVSTEARLWNHLEE